MLTRFSYSGIMGHVLSLAGKLNSQGCRVAVVVTDCPAPLRQAYHDYCRNKVDLFTESKETEIHKLIRHYRFHVLHVHSPALIPLARTIEQNLRLPWGVTVHNGLLPARQENLARAAFIITTSTATYRKLNRAGFPAVFIPEGIDLDEFRPAQKAELKIAYIAESGGYSEDGCLALLKAAALADLPVDLICAEQFPQVRGRFHGWPPSTAPVLRQSAVVVGRGRGLLEGMACGNASLILGPYYGGILEAGALGAAAYPDLSGRTGKEPCYREIFFDLSRLIKDGAYLGELQRRSRKYVLENHDLRLSAELTGKVYRNTGISPSP